MAKYMNFPENLKYQYVCIDKFQNLYVRMWDDNLKKSIIHKIDCNSYVPDIYIPDNNGIYTSHIDPNLKLKKVSFNNHKSFKDTTKQLMEQGVMVHGLMSKPLSFIRDHFTPTIEHNHNTRVWLLDIESAKGIDGFSSPEEAKEPITLIQVYDTYSESFIILGTKAYTDTYSSNFGKVNYYLFQNEREMLENFLRLLEKLDPFGISGWSISGYDIPYITNRLERLNFDIGRLSPVGIVYKENKENPVLKRFYQHCTWLCRGIQIDYQILHPKYTYLKLPDNSLETVLTEELGEDKGKVQYDFYDLDAMYRGDYTQYDITEENKDSELSKLKILIENNDHNKQKYIEEFQQLSYNMFVRYGIRDIEGLIELDKKTNYINTAKNIAYRCGVNIDDVLGTLTQWKQLMYNTTSKDNIILPIKQQYGIPNAIYLGGWTTSKPGKYAEIKSIDFSSLYPNVARTLNAGMDTYIKPENITEDEKAFIDKFFYYYKDENREIIKSENDNIHEMMYFKHLIENKEVIHNFLVERNRTSSAGGMMYSKEKQSVYAGLLGGIYTERKGEQKTMGIAVDEMEKIKQCKI